MLLLLVVQQARCAGLCVRAGIAYINPVPEHCRLAIRFQFSFVEGKTTMHPVVSRTVRLMVACAALAWTQAQADTVVLSNGDRLTGRVLLMDAGKLVLETGYAGEITIKWNQVAQIETDDPMVLRMPGLPIDYEARLEPTDEPGMAQSVEGWKKYEVALDDIERIVRPHPLLGDWSLDGSFDLAGNITRATNDTKDMLFALDTQARHGWWRHSLKLDFARKEQDDVVRTHNYGGRYALDRFLSEKMFVQGRVRYNKDYIENLTHQTQFGLGPGYQFWDNELGAFSLSGLLAHTRYRYRNDGDAEFQALGVGWNYTRYFGGRQWQLFTNGDAYRPLGNDANYSLNAELGMRYNVTNWASLYTKVSQHTVSGAVEDLNETRYSMGLGVTW